MNGFDTLITAECHADTAKVRKAIGILVKCPHLINRRISSSMQLSMYSLNEVDSIQVFESFTNVLNENITVENIEEKVLDTFKQTTSIESGFCFEDIDSSKENVFYIRFTKLLPRNSDVFAKTLEITLIDLQNNCVTVCYLKYDKDKRSLCFDLPYQIKYENNEVSVLVQNLHLWTNNDNLDWIKNNFFNKFLRWIENESPKVSLVDGSLNLIPPVEFSILYNKLKWKYGKEMIKIWPENTDPLKFVYEDVSIATYLLLLWELERKKLDITEKQSFLDLGCGNGLLVHILNSEGHPGFGIDLRRRKIWDLYPETTKLEVRTIIPSSKNLFPETDWIIGNHSDELTPWIPVIAARSSYKCRFFVLPCCAYELDGKKYKREDSTNSQYYDYMTYVHSFSKQCGFKTDMDKLRIPSTKRICIVGTERIYPIEENESQDLKIQEMINTRCNDNENQEAWSSAFKPRDIVEKVRNCTKINRDLIRQIIETVASLLLRKVRVIDLDDDTKRMWNAGGEMELSQVAASLESETLKELKNECGGLQTLLRNNGDIFKIESGKVRFRIPGHDKVGSNKKRKSKPITKIKDCWFFKNHPNGCPLTDDECDYIHSE